MFARTFMASVIGLGAIGSMNPGAERTSSNGLPLVEARAAVSVPSVKKKTINYVGWYARWGHEESCYGYPDLQDIWLVDDQSNEYRVGETAHGECLGYHNGTFAYSQAWIACENQSGGCPMITGTVLSHVHHYQDWCYGDELAGTRLMALLERAVAQLRSSAHQPVYDLASILRR